MKFIFVLALVGASLAARHHHQKYTDVQESSFRADREYQYDFNGQLSAGLPIPSTPQGLTRIQSRVTLQFSTNNKVRAQLTDVKYATSQEEKNIRQMQPIEKFELVDFETKVLSMPFTFTYKNGIVSELRFAQDDQVWSENIKRSVINMMQVNVLRKETERNIEEQEQDQEKRSTFVSMEKTLEGECEVVYSIDESEQTNENQKWTKSINFEKCTRRPTLHHTQVEVCQECEKTLSQEKKSSSVFQFNMTSDFLIDSVELRSQQLFAPIDSSSQLLGAFTINTLKLVYAGEKQQKIEKINEDKQHSELIYDQEWEIAEQRWAQTGEEKYLRQIQNAFENRVEIVEKMISLLTKQIQEHIGSESAHTIARIVDVIRTCNEDDLEKISKRVDENKHQEIRDIYANILTLAATRVTVQEFIKRSEQMSAVKFSVALKSLVELRYPSTQIAEDIVNFCESATNPMVEQSCWLTYGAVVNGACGRNARVLAEKQTCTRNIKEQIVDKLIQRFESASDKNQQILALKTLANCGLDLSVYPLQTIINNNNMDIVIRVQAVEALRRLRQEMPRKIQQVLLPVFKNRQYPQQLRMSAVHQLLQSQPEWPVLSQIAQQLREEMNNQVRAFTVSLLRSFANSESPCEQSFSARVRSMVQTVRFEQDEKLQSRYAKWSKYSPRHQTGFEMNAATLFTSESAYPTEMMASIEGVFAGEWNKYFAQAGVSQKNIQKVLRQIENEGFEQVVVRGKRASDEGFRPSELWRNLMDKLSFTPRQQNTEEPHALVYFRYRDMDFAFIPVDVQLLANGQINIETLEKFMRDIKFSQSGAAFLYETTRRVPTPLGLPVELNSKVPTVANVNGQIKIELTPKNGRTFEGVRAHIKAQPRVAATHIASLTIVAPIAVAGTKFMHELVLNAPIDATIEMNWENKFNMKITHNNTPAPQLLSLQSRPVTFTKTVQQTARQYPEPTENTWMLQENQVFTRELNQKIGSFMVEGTWNTPSMHRIPSWILDNGMTVSFEPTEKMTQVLTCNWNSCNIDFEDVSATFLWNKLDRSVQLNGDYKNNEFNYVYTMQNNHFEVAPTCSVKSSKIITFDKVVYSNKLTKCFSVLAKDCSETPKYIVLMNNNNQMRILYRNEEVEFNGQDKQQMMITVNKKDKKMDENKVVEMKNFKLAMIDESTVQFESTDLTVTFDRYEARIKISAKFHNQQCGLCGHYDNDKDSEFFAANNNEVSIPEFAKSYVYDTEECDFDEKHFSGNSKHFKVQREQEQDDEEWETEGDDQEQEQDEDMETPMKRLLVKETATRICFSQDRVSQCRGTMTEWKKFTFSCVKRNSWSTQQMRIVRENPTQPWEEQDQLQQQDKLEERKFLVPVAQKCF